MHMLFKKENANQRSLLAAVSLFEQAFRSQEEKLQAEVARELHVSPGRLQVKSELQSGNKMHTTFKLEDRNVVTLAHKLEQKVVANQFNPIPSYPIHKMYIEEIFDCNNEAGTPVQLLQQPSLSQTRSSFLTASKTSSASDDTAASMRADPPSCINPWLIEDKCVNIRRMVKCQEANDFVQCYRQTLCEDPQVCPSWKHFSSPRGDFNCKQFEKATRSTSSPSGTDTLLALLEEERQRGHVQPN
jgi:hypothetical protein